MQTTSVKNPWQWIPTLYFVQALPYVMVVQLAGIIYNDFGISNADMAFYTSWMYLPWVIKPLWAPFIDMFRTKRWWTVAMQFIVGAALASVALSVPMPAFFQMSLAILWLMAFSSATHDIAADGFYMLALPQHEQAAFVGVRSTFYRLANVAGQGGLVYLAGKITEHTGSKVHAWTVTLGVLAILFIALSVYHAFILPKPASDQRIAHSDNYIKEYFSTFIAFFSKRDIVLVLAVILSFRLGESQLIKMVVPFLKAPLAQGGLALSTSQVGLVYGTVGVLFLTLGGLLGGYVISQVGLKRAFWFMVFAVHTPDLAFVYLATDLPQNIYLIASCIAFEQFGYGFGFTALMLYMIMVSDGEHKTAFYAMCTGFMALGMMVPGMYSGKVQEMLGYQHFFIYVCLMTLPAFLMAALVKIDPQFGKKAEA